MFPSLLFNNVPLKTVSKQKYLGVILTDVFTDDLDIDRQKMSDSIYCVGNMLIRRFKSCTNSVNPRMPTTFFTTRMPRGGGSF